MIIYLRSEIKVGEKHKNMLLVNYFKKLIFSVYIHICSVDYRCFKLLVLYCVLKSAIKLTAKIRHCLPEMPHEIT